MARRKDPMMAELRRIRRQISREMLTAKRQGRLADYMREMEREGDAYLKSEERPFRTHRKAQ